MDLVRAELSASIEQAETYALQAQLDSGDGVALSERDIRIAHHASRAEQLRRSQDGILFGRVEIDGDALFIGRQSVLDQATHEVLLVDWRAPAARPFYAATPMHPMGVRTRSHIRTQGWKILSCEIEHLLGTATPVTGTTTALLTALDAPRADRMGSMAATIQAEQDAIIRANLAGTLLINGAPGTGKTAVALHRAAYLLYENRSRLERAGVLFIGPSAKFLDYVSSVLPSLGETSVVMATIPELVGVEPTKTDGPYIAELKGRQAIAGAIASAVSIITSPTPAAVELHLESGGHLILPASLVDHVREQARAEHPQHNRGRPYFERYLQSAVARGWASHRAQRFNLSVTDEDVADALVELATDDAFAAAVDRLWPVLAPQDVLSAIATSPEMLVDAGYTRVAADHLAADLKSPGTSIGDGVLLDEAASLLGEDPRPAALLSAREDAEAEAELQYAQGVLDILSDTTADDTGTAGSVVSARMLAHRQRHDYDAAFPAKALADREWVYGHVVVDEAQNLTPMMVRALVRRCPSRSFTLVGDLHQAATARHVETWDDVLGDELRRRDEHRLTVNYRTPAEFMQHALSVLPNVDVENDRPASLRTATEPVREHSSPAPDVTALGIARRRHARAPQRSVAVISSELFAPSLSGLGKGDWEPWIGTPDDARGLEFDSVIVVDPDRIANTPQFGVNSLYVAMTRATQTLDIVRRGEDEPVTHGLSL
ncbi:HelD family protein [Microbacterium sp. K41]|uniref:HelD family protein n=1 Tax=Microbacterium sp. K41 TaxID=2305437 RepID=UPI00109CF1F8|nr:ATP-binding domain-containing protein [Microbacterium sp. K41]